MNIFAYTPHEISPPYISINRRDDGKIYVTVRSKGAREVSEVELPESEIENLQCALYKYLEKTSY